MSKATAMKKITLKYFSLVGGGSDEKFLMFVNLLSSFICQLSSCNDVLCLCKSYNLILNLLLIEHYKVY